jgi:centromere/kinetochore protein ZW10
LTNTISDDDDGPNDAAAEAESAPPPTEEQDLSQDAGPESREVTLSEKYWASSMPKPLFDLIRDIHNDGIHLMAKE